MIDRRAFLAGSVALSACVAVSPEALPEPPDFMDIVESVGPQGRLGFAALDTGSTWSIGHNSDERFAMCSTFKLPLAAAMLAEVEAGRLALAEEIAFGAADLLDYAPVVRANLDRGRLSVEQLCAAIIEVSDNSAANLLLSRIGGPAGLTAFVRRGGDSVTRLDRTEPSLNTNLPNDPRDTTTPAAMLGLMRTLLLGGALAPGSREWLIAWMERATTGRERLRAGLPRNWRVGDKTGTGNNGAHNDVAIAWPPGRAPILIASFLSGLTASDAARNAAHAEMARRVVAYFA